MAGMTAVAPAVAPAGLPADLADSLFSKLRDTPCKVLQLGVRNGAATEAWSRYFSHRDTKVLGLDLKLDEAYIGLDDPKIRLCTINVMDCDLPMALATDDRLEGWKAPYDIILDDASGDWKEQTIAMLSLHRLLRLKGVYVVKNVKSDKLPLLADVARGCGLDARTYDDAILVAAFC
jgi:hypothetical protein